MFYIKPNDIRRCATSVNGEGRFGGAFNRHQCTRKVWKDGYCKLHHPDTVAARNAKTLARQEESYRNSDWNQLRETKKKLVTANETIKELLQFVSGCVYDDDEGTVVRAKELIGKYGDGKLG